jgi:hypothetical protein
MRQLGIFVLALLSSLAGLMVFHYYFQVGPAAKARAERAAMHEQIEQLQARVQALENISAAAPGTAEPPELGAQMLELQIRHARLWFAGDAQNWTLSAFQISELREALAEIVATNAEHPSLQPERLAEVLPKLMDGPMRALQAAVDARDRAAFARAYDGLTAGCNGCHDVASFGFNRFQRPRTPLLDNQIYAPDAR